MKNIENLFLNGAMVLGLVVGGATLNSCAPRIVRPISVEEPIKVPTNIPKKKEILQEIPDAPVYGYPDKYCAAYSIRVARDKFNKNFIYADAWNAGYANKIVSTVRNRRDLTDLIDHGTLKQGMIVGVYFPRSDYRNRTDDKGKRVKYTHLAVYAGVNKQGEPIFYHQFKGEEIKVTLKELTLGVGNIKEVLDERH